MIPTIRENWRQDKQQNQIKTTRLNYDQNSISNYFFKRAIKNAKILLEKVYFKQTDLYFTRNDIGTEFIENNYFEDENEKMAWVKKYVFTQLKTINLKWIH